MFIQLLFKFNYFHLVGLTFHQYLWCMIPFAFLSWVSATLHIYNYVATNCINQPQLVHTQQKIFTYTNLLLATQGLYNLTTNAWEIHCMCTHAQIQVQSLCLAIRGVIVKITVATYIYIYIYIYIYK